MYTSQVEEDENEQRKSYIESTRCRKLRGKKQGGWRKGKKGFFEGGATRPCNRSGAIFIALYLHSGQVARDFSRFFLLLFASLPTVHGGETCSGDRGKNIPPHRHENRIRPGPWHRSRIYDTTCLWHSCRRKMVDGNVRRDNGSKNT